jgi:hypothetical protein
VDWTKLSSIAAAALIASPATAYADCGDPGHDPCTGPVPTVDQVVAIMAELTDPNKPAAAKTDIVSPRFSPDEAGKIDNHLHRHLYLSTPWIVTNIQSAPNNLAGATVAKPAGFRVPPPKPIVLVDQGGHWLLTHRIAMYMLDEFYSADIGVRAIPWCWP